MRGLMFLEPALNIVFPVRAAGRVGAGRLTVAHQKRGEGQGGVVKEGARPVVAARRVYEKNGFGHELLPFRFRNQPEMVQESSSSSTPISFAHKRLSSKRKGERSGVEEHTLDFELIMEGPVECAVATFLIVNDGVSPAPQMTSNLMV